MKQRSLLQALFPIIVMAVPWIYLAFVWKQLPATIPTHFGISGAPDKFGDRNEILLAPAVMTIVGLGMYFILRNIYKIDPKKKYAPGNASLMGKIAVVTIVLLSATAVFIIYWTLHGKVEGMNFFFCGISLFMAYLGNLFHSVKPNYFAGFRLPWTLESEENWRLTHQLASKVWFIGGIAMAVMTLLTGTTTSIIIFISGMMIMVLIPVVYSYNLYRKTSKDQNRDTEL